MLAVGLTGGIGAGKSLVSRIFELLDIDVYISDIAAKRLMNTDPNVREALIETFGTETYNEKGEINRTYLSSIIFNDEEQLKKINSIVHPAVRTDFMTWCMMRLDQDYIVQESALVYEVGLDKYFDKVILVYAPDELRIQRVMDRDNVSREQVLDRIENQMPQSEKVELADFVIYNDGRGSVIKQVCSIHQQILELSRSATL